MIRPLNDYLVLKPMEVPGVIGLIIIPDSGKLRDKTGGRCKVLAAGPRAVLAKVGDTVHVTAYGSKYAGDEIIDGDNRVYLLKERDINFILD